MGNVVAYNDAQTTTNDYASIVKVKLPTNMKRFLIHWKELNVNAALIKILASPDDVTYETIKAETALAKNGSSYETLEDPWTWIDVQVKSAVAETHGSVKVYITGA